MIVLHKKTIDKVFKRIEFEFEPKYDVNVFPDGIDLYAIKVRPKDICNGVNVPAFMEMWCIDHRCRFGSTFRFDNSQVLDRLQIYANFRIVLCFEDTYVFDICIVDKIYLEFFDQCREKILVIKSDNLETEYIGG